MAGDAGYTRGALYHQFSDKEDLAMAVLDWVDETWREEVGSLVDDESDPVRALLTLARGHAVFCRRDFARVAIALRLEFSGQDHPRRAPARAGLRVAGQALHPARSTPAAGRARSRPVRPPGPSRSASSARSRAP